MSEIQGIGRFTFHEAGRLEEFKRLSAQAMDIVRAKDTGTLQYEVYFNDDQSECIVLERYRDDEALIEHGANLGELGQAILATGLVSSELLGEPGAELKALLAGSPVRLFTPFLSIATNQSPPGDVLLVMNRRMFVSVLASAAALTVATPAAATPARPPSWHVLKTVNGLSQDFGAVVATGPASGWAFVDNASYAFERTGVTTWTKVPFPGGNGTSFAAAAATSASDVWAFTNIAGTRSQAVELTHGKWVVRKTLNGYVDAVSVLAANDVWVFGSTATYHYNGSTWATAAGAASGGVALSASDYWLSGASYQTQTMVTHVKNGQKMTFNLVGLLPAKTKNGFDDPQVAGVYAASDTNVYVIGNGRTQDAGGPVVILHYDGHTWTKLASYGVGNPFAITPDGAGGLWIPISWAGGGTILHYSRGAITVTALPSPGKFESTHANGVSRIPGTTRALAITSTIPYDSGTRSYSQILQYG